ncbi:ABC-type sugar transport system, periplasmic component [Mesorhizobium plurifarium]|uniref:ABC-type sugar transport system, periplasmic component n=1 Tax=Mesorhizobium plurifarium TaxID=69974 RepID=A0A090F1B6_MESPL|nr:ABC-type sugar transport system, periplasmic component [Mesorhizobium plurifarium]
MNCTTALRKVILTSLSCMALIAADGTAWAGDKPLRITSLLPTTVQEWTVEIKAGAEAAAKDLGFPVELRFEGPSSFDPSKQAAMFQNEVLRSPDAIIITNIAAPLFIEPVLEAQKKGIKVAWIDSAPSSDFHDGFFVSADPTEMGLAAAAVIAKTLEKSIGKPADEIEGKVEIGSCVPGLAVLENRVVGTRNGLAKLMPKVKVQDTVATKPDREGSFAAWNQAIRKHPDALAYLDACEAGQQNIARIIAENKLKATSVAFDVPEDIRQAVKDGIIPAAIPSSFYAQSYMAVYLTAKALHEGKPLPKHWLKISPLVLDSSNIDAYIEGWKDPVTGLRQFYGPEFDRAKALADKGELAPIADYDNPPIQ